MIKGIFFDLPQATIEAIQAKAVGLILEGKTLMTYSVGGKAAGKQFAMSPSEMLQEASAALANINGKYIQTTYPDFSYKPFPE